MFSKYLNQLRKWPVRMPPGFRSWVMPMGFARSMLGSPGGKSGWMPGWLFSWQNGLKARVCMSSGL